MKVKTNIRAGAGASKVVDTSASTSSSGINSSGVNGNKVKPMPVYYPPVSRCVGY